MAATVRNLGILDSAQDRQEKARQEYGEALRIFRGLAQEKPETYLPHIATTLNNLGILDSDQNRLEEARKEDEEALKIYEALAKQNSEQFSPDVKRLNKLLKEFPR